MFYIIFIIDKEKSLRYMYMEISIALSNIKKIINTV